MSHGRSISVIVPAHNEAAVIAATIRDIEACVSNRFDHAEIVVVNDGSSDRTAEIVESMKRSFSGCVSLELLNTGQNRGKGHAVRSGILRATGQFILMTDADLSTPIDELDNLLDRALKGADIAIASRTIAGARVTVPQPLFRRILGRVYNFLVKALVLDGYGDTQCGFKLFRAEAARAIFSKCVVDGFSFDVEVLYLARKLGYSVAEVPVTWMNRSPHSKVRLRSDYLAMLVDLFRIRRAALKETSAAVHPR